MLCEGHLNAGATPLIHSLLADLFKTDTRVLVSMIVGACIGAGQAIGSAVAGVSGLGWRLPFAVVGIPSVAVATLMWMTTKDPRRGGAEEALQVSAAVPA
jgi:MFS family permease